MIIEFNTAESQIVLTPETIEEANFIEQDMGYIKSSDYGSFEVKVPKIGKVKCFPVLIIKQA